jgi:hypothetical protein
MSYMKNFTNETREQKRGVGMGKNAWRAVQQGRSKLAYGGRNPIFIRYCRKSGYKKSLGGASDPRGCKRGGGTGKRCRICRPPRSKRRNRSIDADKIKVFVV